MAEDDMLARRFEEQRPHLRAVAYRMLGSASEADDAVQEAWLRASRAGTAGVDNLGGWLTTVVARVSLDALRARSSRREAPLDDVLVETAVSREESGDPEGQALLADSVGLALLVVLDTLTPAERLAFVLHDLFAVPFDEIAPIVERTPAAARQLASRARRRVQGVELETDPDLARRRLLVDAFLSASREGDFTELLRLLDPAVVLRADQTAIAMGAPTEIAGDAAVAEFFSGRARIVQPVLIDGLPGAMWASGDTPRVLFTFTFTGATIASITLVADAETLKSSVISRQSSKANRTP